jgi:hypothetical protein
MDSKSNRLLWAAVAFGIAVAWASPASAEDQGSRGPRRAAPESNDSSPYWGPQNVINPADDNDRARTGVRNRSTEDRAGERSAAQANGTTRGQRLRNGLCRIWTPGTPRTQQALGNCDILRTQLPAGSRLIRGR